MTNLTYYSLKTSLNGANFTLLKGIKADLVLYHFSWY